MKFRDFLELNEGTGTSFEQLVSRMRIQLRRDDQALKALVKLYNHQSDSEKNVRHTIHKNFRGFNQPDAKILTSFAEQYKRFGKLTDKQMYILRARIAKYAGQLVNMSIEAGLISNPGRGKYSWGAKTNTATIKSESVEQDKVEIEDVLDIMEPDVDVVEMTKEEFKSIVMKKVDNMCELYGKTYDLDEIEDVLDEEFEAGTGISIAFKNVWHKVAFGAADKLNIDNAENA